MTTHEEALSAFENGLVAKDLYLFEAQEIEAIRQALNHHKAAQEADIELREQLWEIEKTLAAAQPVDYEVIYDCLLALVQELRIAKATGQKEGGG